MIINLYSIVLIIGIALLLDFFDIRFCPFFHLFNIPCVGCGMTRAIKLIINGNILESLNYNLLPIPLLIVIVLYIILSKYYNLFLIKIIKKYKKLIIFIAFIIMIIIWIININNPLLY